MQDGIIEFDFSKESLENDIEAGLSYIMKMGNAYMMYRARGF